MCIQRTATSWCTFVLHFYVTVANFKHENPHFFTAKTLHYSGFQIFDFGGFISVFEVDGLESSSETYTVIHHWKILRGDNVMVTGGKDRGETGVIKRVIRTQNRVIVEGKNLVKKHITQGQGHKGGIFTVKAPFLVSNVQVLDLVTRKPCKVGIKYLEDDTKVRVSREVGASGSIIPRPEILKIRTTPRPTIVGPKNTPIDLVMKKTYDAKISKGMPDL